MLELPLFKTYGTKPFGSRALKKAKIRRMIHETREIGIFVVDSQNVSRLALAGCR